MNKTELIAAVAENANISKTQAAQVLDAVLAAVADTLADGGEVALPGFGSFSVGERAERTGRNPATGETITIAAAKVVKFKAGKTLKDKVNS